LTPRLTDGGPALLARRRPGHEPGLHKGERAHEHGQHYTGMAEYDTWAPVYDAWAANMTEDVPYYVELAREADGPVVELMVGSGRVAIEVVRQTGKPVLGIDSSPAMLAAARERSAGLPLELREGDVRELELDEPAALIYVPFRSLLHLHGWHEKRRVLERVAAALRPGGRFAFNAFVFDHRIAARLDGTTRDQNGVVHTTRYAPADNRIELIRADGATIRLWWATKSEWEGLIDVAGLEVEALYGWFDRRPFDDDSPELVWIARRP
jgi:SAM-dependent methyltransferase